MTETDRLYRWNRWYDQQPEGWRSQIIVWFLVALAAFNTALSIWTGFPLLLLVVLAIAAIALVRVPYRMGWLQAPAGAEDQPATLQIETWDWVHQANRWYDAQPEGKRAVVVIAILVAAGAINMILTFSSGFAFGLLFLLAFLAMIAIRVPYVNGWLKPQPQPPQVMLAREQQPAVAPPPAAIADQGATVPRSDPA